jgi:Citrate synthase, C-terminal domain
VQFAPGLELGEASQDLGLDLLGELHEVAPEALGHVPQHRRAGIGCAVHRVPEAHDALAGQHPLTHPDRGALGPADGVEGVEGPARRAAVEGAGERGERGDDDGAEVGPGRRDCAGHERRGVEAVVDAEDEVLLGGAGPDGVRLVALDHVQVVGGVGQVVAGSDRLQAVAEAVDGGSSTRSTPARPARRRRWAAACATTSAFPASVTGCTASATPRGGAPAGPRRGRPSAPAEHELLATMRERGLPFPNVDLAIAALAERHSMVEEAGEVIFAVARTAAWLAHAAEEYRHSLRFRPRATYTGPAPVGTENSPSVSGAR